MLRSRVALGAAASTFALAAAAEAGPLTLTMSESGFAPVQITGAGSVTYTDPYGTFDLLNVVVGIGSPILPSPGISLTIINAQSRRAAQVTFELSEQGLTEPIGIVPLISGFGATVGSGRVAEIVEATYLDSTDALNGTQQQLGLAKYVGSGAAEDFATVADTGPGPFSETAIISVSTLAGVVQTSETVTISGAPEPASLGPLAVGLFGLLGVRAAARWRAAAAGAKRPATRPPRASL